jgi:hypothetical protein
MAINSGSFGRVLWPGIKTWYGQSYDEYQTEYDKIFTVEKSTKQFEIDMSVSSFGLAIQRNEGSPVSYDTEQQGFQEKYTHGEFALGFIITKIIYEDDQYNIVGKRKAGGLAMSARQTRETFAANILNRAFNSSFKYGDGVELVGSSRPNIRGGTWSNKVATPADISEAALEQAVIDIAKYTDDAGKRIQVRPVKIVVPVDLDFEVGKIMKSEFEVGTSSNTVNLARGRFPGGYMLNHYLTDTDAWFILTDVKNGMKFYERRPDTFSMDDDFDTDNAKYKFTARYSAGCSDKRHIYGSQGA